MRVLAMCIVLAGCGTLAYQPEPANSPSAEGPDPRICADLEDAPDVAGGILQATTQAERDAIQAFLNGEMDLFHWGQRGWTRAEIAMAQYCKGSP